MESHGKNNNNADDDDYYDSFFEKMDKKNKDIASKFREENDIWKDVIGK
jgi:hypothetical protein